MHLSAGERTALCTHTHTETHRDTSRQRLASKDERQITTHKKCVCVRENGPQPLYGIIHSSAAKRDSPKKMGGFLKIFWIYTVNVDFSSLSAEKKNSVDF